MHIDVSSLILPRAIAVIGASAKRSTQGNVVIANLKESGFTGSVFPVHPQAREIDGLPALASVAELPDNTDMAVVAIPAAQVFGVLQELEKSPVRGAIVFANGFTEEQERSIRDWSKTSRLIVHGPNCMGLVNFNDAIPLYPSRPSKRLRSGNVAIVAQSGSAAISVMNSITAGLSKVVTVGSEFHVAAADYIRWLADDPKTAAIGVVAESIKDPVSFALAAEAVHAAGKSLVVLKVGRSVSGMAATQAHTGALVSDSDAFDDFFADTNIATVSDYDELVVALECAAVSRKMVGATGLAIVGISGGQTALACDLADARDVCIAKFSEQTAERLRKALPGTPGHNPVDFGATVNSEDRNIGEALAAVFADPAVGAVAALQDAQESLNPATLENYQSMFERYAESGRAAAKPFAVISPTSESVNADVRARLAECGVPLLRGLGPGLRAVGSLAFGQAGPAKAWAEVRMPGRAFHNARAAEPRDKLANVHGPLAPAMAFEVLRAYGLPVVRAIVVRHANEAVERSGEVGFPMVVKVASADVQHRSDVGGVVLNVANEAGLREAIARIAANVASALPDAKIEGYELQEQLGDCFEAMAGFTAAEPFGPMVVVGTGGTLVEVMADRAVKLAPVSTEQARETISRTKLARVLGGYRNLNPVTDTAPLADLVVRLSQMASDLRGVMVACDLNPVLIRKGSGELRVVDALCICA